MAAAVKKPSKVQIHCVPKMRSVDFIFCKVENGCIGQYSRYCKKSS